jgi:phenylpropionate dioxygenase-like ring-hydroxylating dioxygenase large terminal subunit
MFLSQTHLPQLLDNQHYTSPEFLEQEIERLFLPGWHGIGLTAQFPKDGDFRTNELFGRPLITWRMDGQLRTFLNVCSHRFSTLTDKPCGNAPQRLKCQYHGWEYDHSGNTCKIPDAQSFRPLKKGELGLREYRTETVGQLVFVTFNEQAPPLREFLGPELTALCEKWFTPHHRLTLVTDLVLDCNWKITVENILEAYHIECVHPHSFKHYPEAAHCRHEFHATWDHYIHDFSEEPGALTDKLVCGITREPTDYCWHHILRYPNVVFGGSGPYRYLQMIWPLSATSCRSLWLTMHNPGVPGKWKTFFMHRLLYRYGRYISRRVQREDALIYPSVHRGTAAPDRPHGGGLVSAREERIFTFQEYVLRGTGQPVPVRTAAPTASETPAAERV